MNKLDEKLSLLLDEYADDKASQSVLDEVISDINLQYQMRRYQMIGDVMRHELPTQINPDLSHQIMLQVRSIDNTRSMQLKASDNNVSQTGFLQWARLKPLAGFAVAASVALVSITLWQAVSIEPQENQLASTQKEKINQLAAMPVQGKAVTVSSKLNEGTHWIATEDSPALQQKLNAYLVNHTEYSIPIQGLIPQARVAGFDSQQ